MPEGYNTIMGERGLKLSGGEKQRVALARAFLKKAQILLCDEATSSLDGTTEQEVLGAFHQLAQGRTSVFVAHRLSTAAQCNQVLPYAVHELCCLLIHIQGDHLIAPARVARCVEGKRSFHTLSV